MLYINLFRGDMHANENTWAKNQTFKNREQHDTRSTCKYFVCVQQHCVKLGTWQNTARHHHHCANGKFFRVSLKFLLIGENFTL